MKRVVRLAALIAFIAVLAQSSAGQIIEELRRELRDILRQMHFADSFVGLVVLSDEFELGSATYRFDNIEDTEISSFVIPFHRTFHVGDKDDPALYLEGVIGYAKATEGTDDLYGGAVPQIATSVEADWITYGGVVGLGIEFPLVEGLTVAPIGHIGLSHMKSDADYGGPGAAFTAAIADGIAFNWDALAIIYGCAARVDWEYPLGEDHTFSLLARYDLRWTNTIREDDKAQDFSARSQLLTLRTDLIGPTGLDVFGRPLGWRATGGYRRFLEGDLFEIKDLMQFGGSLELDLTGSVPAARILSLDATMIIGNDLLGWSVGLGLSF